MKQLLLSALLISLLASCASLQPQINEVSLESYQRGCTLRGVQRGLERDKAKQICQCHTTKAIEGSSVEEFLLKTERIAGASKEERQSDPIATDMKLMRDTFQSCKAELLGQ